MTKKPSDNIEFPASEFELAVVDILPSMAPPPKWPALNAVLHLNRAWLLRQADPQMALFRALMAEEEAATALFLCLKRRRYRGAKLLRQRDHVHKNAVIPFFYAMGNVIAQLGDNAPDVGVVTTSDRAALELRIKFKHPKTMEDSWAYPVPPLNFSMSGGPSGQKLKLEDFAAGLDQLISETKAKDIVDYVRDRANQRNQLLYAGAEGYPAVAGDIERGLRVYQQHVFALIQAYLLIDPHSGNQLFVQQVLDAFLKALRLLPKDIEGDVA